MATKREGAWVVRGESGPRGRDLANTVYVVPEHQWAPICLMVDQFDVTGEGGSRHALAPLGRRQALSVAWSLVKAALKGKTTADLQESDSGGGGDRG